MKKHEDVEDDCRTGSAVAINALVEASDVEIGDGQQLMLVNRIIPDLTLDGASSSNPAAKCTVKSRDCSGDSVTESASGSAIRTATSPVEQYTDKIDLRARGRQMAIRVEKDAVGVKWRLGAPRIDVRPDGRR